MILTNPDDQVWNMLTNGVGTAARAEIDALKKELQARKIFFVVDHDDRYHWLRLRSQQDFQIIQVKADIGARNHTPLLELRYRDAIHTDLNCQQCLALLLQYYEKNA